MARQAFKTSIALPREIIDRLDKLAEASGISRSQMIHRFILDGIDQEEIAIRAFSSPVLREGMVRVFGNVQALKEMAQAVGEEMSDDQLKLWHEAIEGVVGAVQHKQSPEVKRPSVKVGAFKRPRRSAGKGP